MQQQVIGRSRGEQLSDAVYAWLQNEVGQDTPLVKKRIAFNDNVSTFGADQVAMASEAYELEAINVTEFGDAMATVVESMAPSIAIDDGGGETTKQALCAVYQGDAATVFQSYLLRCWTSYAPRGNNAFVYPYVALVQSAGFGKSRLLKQLAEQTRKHEYEEMKVLYTCQLEDDPLDTFPHATPSLNEFFFTVPDSKTVIQACASRLVTAFSYAIHRWHFVGDDWFKLFESEGDKDREVAEQLRDYSESPPPQATTTASEDTGKRVLVLVVDEARGVLGSSDSREHDRHDLFRQWRDALSCANMTIAEQFHKNAGVFAIFVDSRSKIANFTPPKLAEGGTGVMTVGTAMDVHHTRQWLTYQARHGPGSCFKTQFYQHLVISRNPTGEEAWQDLVAMGRPLWRSLKLSKNELIVAAANLLAPRSINASSSRQYGEQDKNTAFSLESMHGVASLLCRLGLRPYSSPSLSSATIADMMAVVAYIKRRRDQFICSYSSDPILTLGAAYLWHHPKHPGALATHILPQFRNLMLQETIDTGGIGEAVARILLLLAMDVCERAVMATSGVVHHGGYTGGFYSVQEFLRVLQGPAVDCRATRSRDKADRNFMNRDKRTRLDVFETRWKEWRVGFSHFVQLDTEPTEESLWIMLARRAAGMFPRNHKGVDLVIPVYTPGEDAASSKVSVILIQVKNHIRQEKEWPSSTTTKLKPSNVFCSSNALSNKGIDDVIMLYMDLRGPDDRFFFDTKPIRRSSRNAAHADEFFVLCLSGIAEWAARQVDNSAQNVEFISVDVAQELNLLLNPWSDMRRLIEYDLVNRDVDEERVVSSAELRAAALLVLPAAPYEVPDRPTPDDEEQMSAAGATNIYVDALDSSDRQEANTADTSMEVAKSTTKKRRSNG